MVEATAWSNPLSDCGSNFMYEGKDHPRSSWQLPRVVYAIPIIHHHIASIRSVNSNRQWTIHRTAANLQLRVQNIRLVYSGHLHCLTWTIWPPAPPAACAPCTLARHYDLEQLDPGCSDISPVLAPSQSYCPVVARNYFLLFLRRDHHYPEHQCGSCPPPPLLAFRGQFNALNSREIPLLE